MSMQYDSIYYQAVTSYLKQQSIVTDIKTINFSEFDHKIEYQISKNLIQLRKSLGYSQQRFSALLNISLSQYKKYELGVEIIRFDVSQLLTLKLGFPNLYLLAGTPYETVLNIPASVMGYGKIWYFANSLKDDKFNQYCKLLSSIFELENNNLALMDSGISEQVFASAMEENSCSTYIAIADGIRAIRNHLGLSQSRVSEIMGVSQNTYQSYEKNTQTPRFNLLTAVHYLAGMGINSLIIVQGTHYLKIRKMQNVRLNLLEKILSGVSLSKIQDYMPVFDGFFKVINQHPSAQFYELDL